MKNLYPTFAATDLENFMRYYVGFYTQQPDIIRDHLSGKNLLAKIEASRSLFPFSERLDALFNWYHSMLNGDMVYPQQHAVEIPRRVSDVDDSSIVVFLDEFQNTCLPQNDFDIVGWMKAAVESNTCPHFVTSSALSILAREILGRRALFGRFRSLSRSKFQV